MRGIVMDFGPVRAVDHVDFTVQPGEIVGLLGENGAGKTTLMNILAGTFPPVAGEILIDEVPVHMQNPQAAAKHGIRFIHQELSLCDDLRVYENMFLAQELVGPALLVSRKEMLRRCEEVFARMNVEIDPNALVGTLQPAEQQLIEIGRALLFECSLIIMDEPTTALSNHEVEKLFVIMRQLKEQGVSFIYISHKMPELFEICDSYFVMRDGKYVAEGQFAEIDESGITELMIGRQLADDAFDNKPCHATDEVVLHVDSLSGPGFEEVSFDLHRGEVIAITGLQGSGRDMLADALFGAVETSGTVEVNGSTMPARGGIRTYMKHQVAMVPRARKERGILNDLSIYDNTSMGFLNTKFKGLLISGKAERERFAREQEALQIKVGNPKDPITSLSGGNQQKVILGRWLEADADILLFDNPTQGIDVGTKFEIYHLILRLAEMGKSIIVFSSEYPEIYKVADRCLVMYKGRVNAQMERADMSEQSVMYYSTGANLEGVKNG